MIPGSSHYEGEAGERYHSIVHGQLMASNRSFKARASLARYRYFRSLSPQARVLDYGVGTGISIADLPNEIRDGYDVSEFARRIAESHGIRVFADPGDIPSDFYDTAICRHVLEHVNDPVGVLMKIGQSLRDSGELRLIVPVERSGRRYRVTPPPDINMHLWAWNLQHLVNLLDICGFEISEFKYHWYSGQEKLRFLSKLGIPVYSIAVALVGRARRQRELLVLAKPKLR